MTSDNWLKNSDEWSFEILGLRWSGKTKLVFIEQMMSNDAINQTKN